MSTTRQTRPRHRAARLKVGDREASVDRKLVRLIRAMWVVGIETSQCCEENEPGIAWIQFPSAPDALRFLTLVHARSRHWSWDNDGVSDSDRMHQCVSLRFPAEDIRKITRDVASLALSFVAEPARGNN
jgi:hypothetical protein